MQKILVLDNYDSFTYNLVHILGELGYESGMTISRNDKIRLEEVSNYDAILLSPGPGLPRDAGIMPELLREYGPTKKILGVCLGHQAIGECYGAKLLNLSSVFHGIATDIKQSGDPLFYELPETFKVCRYHSWVIKKEGFPDELKITAEDDLGSIMAVSHRKYDVCGVQFHPESIMTEHGKAMIQNWLKS